MPSSSIEDLNHIKLSKEIQVGRSFKNRSFKNSYWPPHRRCYVMKDGMSGMLQQVRLGQVRKARKSSIIWPPLLSMSLFWNSEKNRLIRGHPGGVRWWKNGLRGLFKQVRLGQVRKAIKSWKSEAQSIRWPVLDKNLKDRFSKERRLFASDKAWKIG